MYKGKVRKGGAEFRKVQPQCAKAVLSNNIWQMRKFGYHNRCSGLEVRHCQLLEYIWPGLAALSNYWVASCELVLRTRITSFLELLEFLSRKLYALIFSWFRLGVKLNFKYNLIIIIPALKHIY